MNSAQINVSRSAQPRVWAPTGRIAGEARCGCGLCSPKRGRLRTPEQTPSPRTLPRIASRRVEIVA